MRDEKLDEKMEATVNERRGLINLCRSPKYVGQLAVHFEKHHHL